MQEKIKWKSDFYQSQEHCMFSGIQKFFDIRSVIKGHFEETRFVVDYHIVTDAGWNIISFRVEAKLNEKLITITGEKNGNRQWMINNELRKEFDACTEIDISLTPFTNSLPINRLKLPKGGKKQIDVVYIDLLEQKTMPVKQQYTRLDEHTYKFENVPNDFEAEIEVDANGLVKTYPGLFERIG